MNEFVSLFDGKTLNGWYRVPRQPFLVPQGHPLYEMFTRRAMEDKVYFGKVHRHTGHWEVVDGAIEGRRESPNSEMGGFLVTNGEYGDFELILEARPDWPVDTGIFIRCTPDVCAAIQVLLDYRKSGGLAGFFGNGIGNWHAVAFNVDGAYDDAGNMIGVTEENLSTTNEPITPEKIGFLTYSAEPSEFFQNWKFNDWNEYRIICRGEIPVVTVYVNGLKAAEVDMNRISKNGYTPEDFRDILGTKGHIALEIHENIPGPIERWGDNAACRWRNIRIRALD